MASIYIENNAPRLQLSAAKYGGLGDRKPIGRSGKASCLSPRANHLVDLHVMENTEKLPGTQGIARKPLVAILFRILRWIENR